MNNKKKNNQISKSGLPSTSFLRKSGKKGLPSTSFLIKSGAGFTFIEVLVVVAIITTLAVAVIITVNPAKRFEEARDRQREIHLKTILNAIELRINVERGWFPPCEEFPQEIDEEAFPIFETIGTKDEPGFYDLYKCLIPVYLSKDLFDPAEGSIEDTKYQIWQNPYNKNISLRYVKGEKEIVVGPEEYWVFSVPTLNTKEVTNISYDLARSGGTLIDEGDSDVFERGLVWATSSYAEYPTILDNKIIDQFGTQIFSLNITGLKPNTYYSVRAYGINNIGEGYGNRKEFLTCTLQPRTNTLDVVNVSYNRATIRGEIICVGTNNPDRYFEWGTTTDYGNTTSIGVGGVGVFSADLTNLAVEQTYYFRACGQNTSGVHCGTQKSFTAYYTKPVVTTASITDITYNSATSGGNVTDEGGTPVTARGVCWSSFGTPTITDDCTTNGIGFGSFVSYMTNLESGVTYYIRAYATNNIDTGYGEVETFETIGYCINAGFGGDPGGIPLSCSVKEGGCLEGETAVLKISSLTNAHAEMKDQAFYNHYICCLGNELDVSCEGKYDTYLKLAKITNSHVEKKDQQNYPLSGCLSTTYGTEAGYPSTIACSYVNAPNNCSDLGELYTCLGSIYKDTNSHIGDCNAYSTKVCCANICP